MFYRLMVISVFAVSIEIIDKFAQAGGSRLKTIYRFLRHWDAHKYRYIYDLDSYKKRYIDKAVFINIHK